MLMMSFYLVNNLDCELFPGLSTVADSHHCEVSITHHLAHEILVSHI